MEGNGGRELTKRFNALRTDRESIQRDRPCRPPAFGRHPEERLLRRRISLRCQQARPPTVTSAAPAANRAAPSSAFPKKPSPSSPPARSADAYHPPPSNSAPEGRHKLARAVRPGKQKRLSSNFLSRGLL